MFRRTCIDAWRRWVGASTPITRSFFWVASVFSLCLLASIVMVLRLSPAAGAEEWPDIAIDDPIAVFDQPVHVTHAGDGSDRLFVVEQVGRIRVVDDGKLLSTPFLSITDRVSCCGERGLLSLAFPPDYAGKGHFYVNYTDVEGDTVVARYRVTEDPNRADPASEEIILMVDQPYSNHNGGQLAFGPRDGYLYIGMGDGGSGGDPGDRAQNPAELLGKLLRIDVESAGVSSTHPYTVPAGNPYTRTMGYRDEIWALGLRNPWRFSFDRKTGDLYIGDVGQGTREEVDFQPGDSAGGENYGWNIMEGSLCFEAPEGCTPPERYSPPVAEYGTHDEGCAITGGIVYRGARFPALDGIYFYTDYCSGRLWALKQTDGGWETAPLFAADLHIASFGEDESGNVYVVDRVGGGLYELVGEPPAMRGPFRFYLPPLLRSASGTSEISVVFHFHLDRRHSVGDEGVFARSEAHAFSLVRRPTGFLLAAAPHSARSG